MSKGKTKRKSSVAEVVARKIASAVVNRDFIAILKENIRNRIIEAIKNTVKQKTSLLRRNSDPFYVIVADEIASATEKATEEIANEYAGEMAFEVATDVLEKRREFSE